MKQNYRDQHFQSGSRQVIEQANEILEDYAAQGLRVTLRQLYYQFVSRDLLANTDKNYKRLGSIISDGRLAGLIDWDIIEDRGRVPWRPTEWNSADQIVDAALQQFRLPRWKGQKTYVEIWVEKQALVGVLEPLARKYHVTLMANKGYSSQSSMREAAERYLENTGGPDLLSPKKQRVEPLLLYLGDHDPSGEDMVRDIRDRLMLFGVGLIRVEKIALTMAQVRQYNPPPNPAKTTDSRFAEYEAKHGDESWELDALAPPVLQKLVSDRLDSVIDQRALERVLAEEDRQRKEMQKAIGLVRKST